MSEVFMKISKNVLFKMITSVFASVLIFGTFISCSKNTNIPEQIIENDDSSITITRIDEDSTAVKFNQKYEKSENVTVINCAKTTKNNLATISLKDYSDRDLLIEFSCDLKIVDKSGNTNEIIWMINEINDNFPELYHGKPKSGEWVRIRKQLFVHVGANRQIYISGAGLKKEDLKLYIKDFKMKITGDGLGKTGGTPLNWTEAPSLKTTFAPHFDYIGMAVPYNSQTKSDSVANGIKYQLDCITTENEFKPDFIFSFAKPGKLTDFKAEDGKIYKVPADIPNFKQMDSILSDVQKLGIKMRGHVLVWHSQTPDWFFYKNYDAEKQILVSPEEMTAREEWYIKSVLNHVKDWETQNNNGEHIIFAWDVVNEAISDNSLPSQILRTGSKWYEIYQNEKFITNAFRFANKYAPKDVKLVYNDYGCSSPAKNKSICTLVDLILKTPGARIDAVGMQTHVNMSTKVTGTGSFETAIQNFTAKGLNVQITEMDIAQGKSIYNPVQLKAKYKEFFEMFLANKKTDEKPGIEGITFWGLKDEWTWLNGMQENKGYIQHPLLFQGDNFQCKPAFFGVIEAAENTL